MSLVSLSDKVSKFAMVMAAAWIFVVTIVVAADIASRFVLGAPLNGAREIVANTIVMIAFLHAGYAVRCGSMLRTDFLIALLPWPVRRVFLAMGYGFGAVLFIAIFAASWTPAVASWSGGAFGGLHIPMGPVRFLILAGAALAVVNYVLLAWRDLFGEERSIDGDVDDLRRLES